MDIIGVHLDRRSTMPHVEAITAKITAMGRAAWFYNVNAADDGKRKGVLDDVDRRLAERAKGETVRVLMHSLAFGSLRPALTAGDSLTRMQVEMTLDVMSSSLLYWTQDLVARGHLAQHGRVYAMTSEGSRSALASYGAVSAAKAALEAWTRQLALEGEARFHGERDLRGRHANSGAGEDPWSRSDRGEGRDAQSARSPHDAGRRGRDAGGAGGTGDALAQRQRDLRRRRRSRGGIEGG
jgi:hypothetical protein